MGRYLFIAVACLLCGALAGNSIARYSERQHQYTRAAMRLAQLHLDKLSTAAAQCKWLEKERNGLGYLSAEIAQVFPLAYAQETAFRKYADDLLRITRTQAIPAACKEMTRSAAEIRDGCDACHREYRQ